jgi:WD40 repeat protein
MGHTATLLVDGRVLIAGGDDAGGNDATAELYDPKTGKFSRTGSMSGPRSRATATLLSDGRVLIVGGWGTSGPVASAELYDPATGMFTATGSMSVARIYHTATLLPDGHVLIAGGYDGLEDLGGRAPNTRREQPPMAIYPSSPPLPRKCLASAELYDPATGTFAATGSMKDGREGHTATMLATGAVLIAGGSADFLYGPNLASAELYAPSTGKFTATGSMTLAGGVRTATLLSDGRVLVTAGPGTTVGGSSTAELYEPQTGKFAATGSIRDVRSSATATRLSDGRVLVVGGNGASGVLGSAELYDPGAGEFTAAGQLATARSWHTATLLHDGRVLIVGGIDHSSNTLASAELYQP